LFQHEPKQAVTRLVCIKCLMKIINEIINELLEADTDKNRTDKIRSGVNNIMKGAH